MNRDEFKTAVFERDDHRCINCGKEAVDAHHIIDRSLWDDGGYYIDNGVSLCSECHLKAEQTLISCDELREKAGIQNILLPEHFYSDEKYDKWGNIVLTSGMRIKGELFQEESVQRIFREAGVLKDFLPYIKYPRTYHFPWSENLQNDDRMHENVNFLLGKPLIVTEKLDGENTSMYSDKIHARSIDSGHHESRSLVKGIHGSIAHDIPSGWRICGENMYAKHSIHYHHLKSSFYVFSIWDQNNVCLSWKDTVDFCELLGLVHVPIMASLLVHDIESLKGGLSEGCSWYKSRSKDDVEGYVVRVIDAFPYKDYRRSVAKFVRKGHVQSSQFWMREKIVRNGIV